MSKLMKLSPYFFSLCLALSTSACGSDAPQEDAAPDGEFDEFVVAEGSKEDAQGIQELSYDAICVLSYVNQANEADLLEVAHKLPAQAIWKTRLGPDGKIGTADDVTFQTVEALDDVSWVGYFTFRAFKKHAKDGGFCPALGEETLVPGEDEMAVAIGERSAEFVREHYQEELYARRDAHAKAHGCVKAFVTVDNQELSPEERIGVFAENTEHPAWIRFSNGNPVIQNDKEKDARGFALKVMEVPGDKILDAERTAETQDFLMINGPAFFVRSPSDYLEFSLKAFDGSPISFFVGLNPLEWKIREVINLLAIATAKPSSPITQYWSTVPYALGDKAVKYSARPCGDFEKGWPSDPSPDFLGETLVDQLAAGEQCFDFMIQRQIDPASTPIEDGTIEWSESAFVKVAQIRIPQQTFKSQAQQDFCDSMSFNPWHSLPEHRPLGNINRTRRIVYDMISGLRHELNERPRVEPTGHIDFE
jgi:hypothetical protein